MFETLPVLQLQDSNPSKADDYLISQHLTSRQFSNTAGRNQMLITRGRYLTTLEN